MSQLRRILLVEDDQVDAITVHRAFKCLGSTEQIVHMAHGEAALTFLKSELNARPDLILLDLNMPRMSGIDFLLAVKHDPGLSKIPVVVLTTSSNDRDILQTFHLCAAGYMLKPVDYEQFVETIRVIDSYWKLSRLPVQVAC